MPTEINEAFDCVNRVYESLLSKSQESAVDFMLSLGSLCIKKYLSNVSHEIINSEASSIVRMCKNSVQDNDGIELPIHITCLNVDVNLLTRRKKDIYTFIRNFICENEMSPTEKEIADGIGITSRGTVHRYIHELKDMGYIDIVPGVKRNIILRKRNEN